MEAPFLAVVGDPQLLEIAICLGIIGVLRWILLPEVRHHANR